MFKNQGIVSYAFCPSSGVEENTGGSLRHAGQSTRPPSERPYLKTNKNPKQVALKEQWARLPSGFHLSVHSHASTLVYTHTVYLHICIPEHIHTYTHTHKTSSLKISGL